MSKRNSQVYLDMPLPPNGDMSLFLELTVTSDINIQRRVDVSKQPTLSSKVVSDNAVNQPLEFTINGLISDIPNSALIEGGFQRGAEENFRLLNYIIDYGEPFTLHFDNSQTPIPNCLISNLDFKKTSGMGTSYNVSLSVSQILLSKESLISSEQFASDLIANQHEGLSTKKVASTTDSASFNLPLRGGIAAARFSNFIPEEEETPTNGD